ncbi:MAG: DNRLRE domain-containing protein, partial [Anaerolineae bacterium]
TGWSGPHADITIGAYAISRTMVISETTWNESYSGDVWSVAGCNDLFIDRRPQPEYILTTSGPRRWYQFDLTALVQDWMHGVLRNNGVLLRQEVYSPFTFFFASNEYSDPTLRPRLVVRYH